MAKQEESNTSSLWISWNEFRLKWLTTGRLVSAGAVVVIGIAATMLSFRGEAHGAGDTSATQPSVLASGPNSAAAGRDATNITASGGSVAAGRDADNHAKTINATASGPNGTAQAAETINNNHLDLKGLEHGLRDWEKQPPGRTWQEDERGEYIELPFEPSRETWITPPISIEPFKTERRAVVELANVSDDGKKSFALQVKAMRLFADENRQAKTSRAYEEFTIQKKAEGDKSFYLAWRGEGLNSREQFMAENSKTVIVIRLLK